jgi:CBS domain containing-hemolysin-like protein
LFLDEATRLEDALRRLQRSGHHFAIVMGADRREHGLITLWDILRTVFGDAASARAAAKEDAR